MTKEIHTQLNNQRLVRFVFQARRFSRLPPPQPGVATLFLRLALPLPPLIPTPSVRILRSPFSQDFSLNESIEEARGVPPRPGKGYEGVGAARQG